MQGRKLSAVPPCFIDSIETTWTSVPKQTVDTLHPLTPGYGPVSSTIGFNGAVHGRLHRLF